MVRNGLRHARWLVGVVLGLHILSSSAIASATEEQPYRVLMPAATGKRPAVLLVPGCSGLAAVNGINLYDERAAELQAAGYVVLFLDYVTRRMQTNCAHISTAAVAADITAATSWLRQRPDVDASRISVIAWSTGGAGALAALASMSTDRPFSKAVLYYPVCRGAKPWSAAVSTLILLGGKDDIAFPTLCDALTSKMPSDRVRVLTYPDARHGFDSRGLPERQNPPSGTPSYNDAATKASWSAVLEFLSMN